MTGQLFEDGAIRAVVTLAAVGQVLQRIAHGSHRRHAALYRKSPVGLGYTAGLDVELATLLQTAAWETAQDYFKP